MSRYVRNTVLLAKTELTYGAGIGAQSWLGSDAILIKNATFTVDRDVVDRDLVRNFLGGSEQMVATRRARITFDVELAGSGTAGTAPAWGRLLRACGMAEAITAGNRVEYTPVSTGFESLVFFYHIDGARYVARGCRGTVQVKMNAYNLPYLSFAFTGFDTNTTADVPPVTANFSGWQRPLVISDANAGDIRLGGTYAAGVVSGGTVLASKGLELDLGNEVEHIPLLGGEAVDITARASTGQMTVFLLATDEATWRSEINNNVLTSLGFNFGLSAGNRIAVFAPAVQRVAPQVVDEKGRVMIQAELRLVPSAGNDELRIVAR